MIVSFLDPRTMRMLIAMGLLIGILAVGFWIMSALRRRQDERPLSDEELLAQFHKSYEAGEIDEEEYQRVRQSFTRRGGLKPGGVDLRTPRSGRKASEPEGPARPAGADDELPPSDANPPPINPG